MTHRTHKKRFVTPREIWTLYWVMIGAAFFWGIGLSLAARWAFRFNREAFMFLAVLTVVAGLCAGFTLYAGMRRLLERVQDRAVDTGLDLG